MLPAAARGFLTGPVVQGPVINWQYLASLVGFDPTLLSCAKKRRVEPPGRSCPKEPLGKGFLWTPPQTEGLRPLWLPELPGIACLPVGGAYVLLSTQSSGVRQICNTRLGAKQISSGNFFALGRCILFGVNPRPPPKPAPQGFLQSKNALRRLRLPSL